VRMKTGLLFFLLAILLTRPVQAGMAEATAALLLGNTADAAAQFRTLADAGQPDAQFELAKILAVGKGMPRDLTQAEQWMRRSAERGFEPAQAALGQMYAGAYGMTPNPKLGYVWLSLAAVPVANQIRTYW
jgi:TPR repeat protein